MNSTEAIMLGILNRGREMRVFDWDKAARLIREHKPSCATAGLSTDMEWTSGIIYEDGEAISNSYTYLSSTWAKPVLLLDDGEEIDCYVMESETEWDAHTKWPQSAINILLGDTPN